MGRAKISDFGPRRAKPWEILNFFQAEPDSALGQAELNHSTINELNELTELALFLAYKINWAGWNKSWCIISSWKIRLVMITWDFLMETVMKNEIFWQNYQIGIYQAGKYFPPMSQVQATNCLSHSLLMKWAWGQDSKQRST